MSAPATEAALLALEALRETLTARYQCEWRGTASACNCLDCRCDRAIARLRATPPAAEPADGWYCAACKTGVRPEDVTFEEAHVACGRTITDDRAPEPAPAATDAEARLRLLCQRVVEVVGADGPCDAEEAVERLIARNASAEARCERLRGVLAEIRYKTPTAWIAAACGGALADDDAAKEAGR